MQRLPRCLLALVFIPIALVLVMASQASASAPRQATPATAAAPIRVFPRSSDAGILGAAAPNVCTPTMQLPHRSSHDPSRVNWIVNIVCLEPVASLTATIQLNWVYHMAYGPVVNGNFGQLSLQSQIDAPCNTGTYQGIANWTVTFMSGFTGTSHGATALTPIACS
jgi:hypothetical protein